MSPNLKAAIETVVKHGAPMKSAAHAQLSAALSRELEQEPQLANALRLMVEEVERMHGDPLTITIGRQMLARWVTMNPEAVV